MLMRRLGLILLFILLLGSFYLGMNIPVSDQLVLVDSLKTVAAVIFGVIGAWIALIYPQALEELLTRNSTGRSQTPATVAQLLKALIYVTAVLLLIIPFEFFYIVLRNQSWALTWRNGFRGIAFSVVAFMALVEVRALILTLQPTEGLRAEIKRLRNRVFHRNHAFSHTQEEPKPRQAAEAEVDEDERG